MRPAARRNRIAAFIAIIFFILVTNLISQDVRSFFIRTTSPVHMMFSGAGISLSNTLDGLFQFSQLAQSNKNLVEENILLSQKLLELRALETENSQLREALDLGIDEDFQIVIATVIGKNIAEDILIVQTDKSATIQEGMPVITPSKVVVGRVIETDGIISKVQLVSARDTSFDAKVTNKDTTGIIRGDGASRVLFDLVLQETDLQKGDIIVTSNLGGVFPENLLIGSVEILSKGGVGAYQKAVIEPYFQIQKTNFVFVITAY